MPSLHVVPDLEAELDRLYGLPLEEFTAARNDLAARLRRAGQRETAESVKRLAKPTVSAWLANQLARRRRPELDALLAAGEKVRRSQARALSGEGGDDLRAAAVEERAAVRTLTERGRELLQEEGRPVTDAVLDRLAASLRAAAVDEEARQLLAGGRLERDVEGGGFELVASLAPAAAPRRRPGPVRSQRDAGRERRLERLRERAQELEQTADAAERHARNARREAEAAERRAADARAAADRAARALADALADAP